jgi:hypothetical protein
MYAVSLWPMSSAIPRGPALLIGLKSRRVGGFVLTGRSNKVTDTNRRLWVLDDRISAYALSYALPPARLAFC